MKESIGSLQIFAICLTFILLFTVYLAVSVNYSKAFRLKSHIVSRIESNEGYMEGREDIKSELATYLVAQGYSAHGRCPDRMSNGFGSDGWKKVDCIQPRSNGECGACIYQIEIINDDYRKPITDDIDTNRSYYKAVTFFNFDIPLVSNLLKFSISGDTKLIYEE